MTKTLAISLLGNFQVVRNKVAVAGIESDRGRALLAYLAVEADRPHRRDALGALFWPDADDGRMRQNLRRALYNLRQKLEQPDSDTPLLLATTQDVQFNLKADFNLDVLQFRNDLVEVRQHVHVELANCARCQQHLANAVALYRGDFLSGFSLPDCDRFEEWRLLTQESLHVQMLDALGQLAAIHHARQEYAPAIAYLQRQIELEAWREEAHRELMRLFALRGERSAALAQYALCQRLLEQELGVPPAPETERLYEQILKGELISSSQTTALTLPTQPAVPRYSLPVPVTPFIGRHRALATLAQRLADPACRVLTMTGLGGVGKTQLAIAAAHAVLSENESVTPESQQFAEGVIFVSLAELVANDVGMDQRQDSLDRQEAIEMLIAAAIANAFGLELQTDASPIQQLGAYLRDKACLLILDNYEHVLGGADVVGQLVMAAPKLKVLVTSRQPLRLSEEWLLPIDGLAVPMNSHMPDLPNYESVALFVHWARRRQSFFALDADNQDAVVEICQLVEGLPLGLILAAACYPELTCAEIAAEIRANLAVLSAQPDRAGDAVSSRHQSVQAVFEASWQLLNNTEQQTLARAAVFQGGFSRQAGLQVASATLGDLSGLVSRVFVRRSSNGRYIMHELLRQFASAKLMAHGGLEANTTYERHSHYYLDWAAHQSDALASVELPRALANLRIDFANLRSAWLWAAAHGQVAHLSASVDVLMDVYEASGLLTDAAFVVTEAIRQWIPIQSEHEHILGQAKLTLALARVRFGQGQLSAAAISLEQASALAALANDAQMAFACMRMRLQIHMAQGTYDEAEKIIPQLMTAAAQTADRSFLAVAHLDAGKLALDRHRYAEAQHAIEQTLQISQTGGVVGPLLQDRVYLCLGLAAYYQGNMSQAKHYDEQGVQLARSLGLRLRVADHLLHLGAVHDALGDYGAAQACYQEALAIHRERGSRQHEISVLGNLGISTAYLGDYRGAIDYTERALALQMELGQVNQSAIGFVNLALFHHQLGEQQVALQFAQKGIAVAQADGDCYIEGFGHTFKGHAHVALNCFAEAQVEYQTAMQCYGDLNLNYLMPEPQAGMARIHLTQHDVSAAYAAIAPILNGIAQQPLEGVEEPMRVYFTCYQVLMAYDNVEECATTILKEAHTQLQTRAARIHNEQLRERFLTQVAAHRAIVEAWNGTGLR